MSMMDVQVKEMKSMGEAIRKLESTREISHSQEKMMEAYARSNMENGKGASMCSLYLTVLYCFT